ncbi:MAG: ABC transporter permease [Calditrichaeota bacterium]|nr:ABC transporter permease [Calditrichota bacterium]
MGRKIIRSLYSYWESFRMALDAMRAHKMRALLTLVGVVIGVATIISMMTVLGGIKYKIDDAMLNSLGANVFQVQRYDSDAGIHFGPRRRKWRPKIEESYAKEILERCPSVRAVGVESWTFGRRLSRGGMETNSDNSLAGGSVEFGPNNSRYVTLGRPITQQDVNSARRVIVLGYDAYKSLYYGADPIGTYVRVDGQKFEVIGVFEERGEMFGESQDRENWIPLSTFERIYGEKSVNLTVQAWDPKAFRKAQGEVIEAMRVVRGLRPGEENNFGMWTPDLMQKQFTEQTAWIGIAAFGICGISLLVAGIGIMNIMLVSVTERTREIGVRKALGGTRSSILRQFLIEATTLSLVGGAIGILLGYGVAIFINNNLNFPAPVPVWAVLLAAIFCTFVGVGFGMWPAVKASRLDPIDALRYE